MNDIPGNISLNVFQIADITFTKEKEGVKITDVYGEQYALLTSQYPYNVCQETEVKFCYHDPDLLTDIPQVEIVIYLYHSHTGTKRKITVPGVNLQQKTWGTPSAIIKPPHFLAGSICIYNKHTNEWELIRTLRPHYFDQTKSIKVNYQRDVQQEIRFIRSAISAHLADIPFVDMHGEFAEMTDGDEEIALKGRLEAKYGKGLVLIPKMRSSTWKYLMNETPTVYAYKDKGIMIENGNATLLDLSKCSDLAALQQEYHFEEISSPEDISRIDLQIQTEIYFFDIRKRVSKTQ